MWRFAGKAAGAPTAGAALAAGRKQSRLSHFLTAAVTCPSKAFALAL